MYTFLEDFKTHGIKAQPYFVMTLFDELLFRKGKINIDIPLTDLRDNSC